MTFSFGKAKKPGTVTLRGEFIDAESNEFSEKIIYPLADSSFIYVDEENYAKAFLKSIVVTYYC